MSAIGTPIVIGFYPKSQMPDLDERRFNNGVPWASIEAVLSGIPMISRAQYLTVNIAGVEYWFEPDLVTLVPKSSPSTPSFVGLIEEKSFEFRDIDYEQMTAGTPQPYVLNVKAAYDYQIESIVFQIETGTLTGLRVWIGETPVAPFINSVIEGGVTETPAIDDGSIYHKRIVSKGESVMFEVRGFTGTPTYLRGSLITKRL